MVIRKFAAVACAVIACLSVVVPPAHTASQGDLGATSSGTVGISVTVPQLVRIQGMSDLAINPYSGPSSAASSNVCVFSSTAGGYDITAASAEGGFTLNGVTAPAESIAYSVEWAAASGAGSGASLVYGTALTGLSTGGAVPACANVGGANATLIVRLRDSDLGTASAQIYAGTLNIIIAPR